MLRGLFAIPALLLCLTALPAASGAQQSGEEAKKPEKKKARKIWTNDDFPSRSRPVANPEVKPEAKIEVADPWAELDKAREDLALEQENLEYYRRDLEQRREDRSREFDPARREALDLAIQALEGDIAASEAKTRELEARIAALEKLTKGRRRPKNKSFLNPQTSSDLGWKQGGYKGADGGVF